MLMCVFVTSSIVLLLGTFDCLTIIFFKGYFHNKMYSTNGTNNVGACESLEVF